MIETVRCRTLVAGAAAGMLIEIDLVQDQAGLTQQQREQQVANAGKHRLPIHQHGAGEYAETYVAGKAVLRCTRVRPRVLLS